MAIDGKVYAGWRKASIYDPATGTTVQINNIATEGTSLTIENVTADTTSSRIYGGKSYTLSLSFYDDAGASQLLAWTQDFTPVRVVIAGAGNNLQWYEDTLITFYKQPRTDKRTGLSMYTIEMEHISDNPAIYENQNLMAYLGNIDSGSFQFPIADIPITFSANATGTGGLVIATAANFATTNLISDTVSVTATGIITAQITTPATTYNILFNSSTATTNFHAVTTNELATDNLKFMSW